VGRGVPNGLESDVCVVSRYNFDILGRSMAKNRVIGEDVDVGVRDGSRVFGGIGQVDLCLQRQTRFGRVDDPEVSNRMVE